MSNLSQTTTVTLRMNGDQARSVLDDLKKRVEAARKKVEDLEKAKAAPKDIERARREAKRLQREFDEARSSIEVVHDVMQNLDKVSLRTLEKTLKNLNKQFKDADKGSEAYMQLAENIRLVREQLSAVKDDIGEQKSLWERFKSWAMDAWPALDLIHGWYDSAISTMRGFVDAYADMDQEMASVRKYTGMTESDVAELNEQFKKMDTRSSREQLNMLAQDAGRLGKTSVEDVMGFVRAADKINVALDDLGDGATLTLSKLTGIFGYEEQYGTEQSLLKVGSVINELSQNCSASAPYIADFTERLAGVGAQANMSIPQIMGFAAVLDSNSQKVEASATALSQVIVRLYQDPAKYAKVAGLDVKQFTDLLQKDANAALILFLETLQKAGGMDVLSPMFKDMGENGSRAIAALSTLAGKIDDVKAQQEAANVAFTEGTSIGTEFDVQNNTIAASLDKCKNAAHEYQVELGQHLYPLMSHVISSSAAMAKALLVVLRYVMDHKTALGYLAVATLAYVTAIKWATIESKIFAVETAICNTAVALFTATVKTGTVVLAVLTGNFKKARTAWLALSAALKASPVGLLVAALATVITYVVRLTTKTDEYRDSVDKTMKSATSFAESLHQERSELDKLFGKLDAARKGTKEYHDAKEAIISRYGVYLQGLINENGEITNLAAAYDRLAWAAQRSAQARSINEAKNRLDSEFMQNVDDKTEKIRERLQDLGVAERDITRIVTEISSSLATGKDVPDKIREEVDRIEKERGHWYEKLPIIGKDSASDILDKLVDDRQYFTQRQEKLSAAVATPATGLDNEALSSQIDTLKKALSENLPSPTVKLDITVGDEFSAHKVVSSYGHDIEVDAAATQPKNTPQLRNTGSQWAAGTQKDLGESLSGYLPESSAPAPAKVTKKSLGLKSNSDGTFNVSGSMSRAKAEELLRELLFEQSKRPVINNPDNAGNIGSGTGYESEILAEKERKKREAEDRRNKAKERKEFKAELDRIKGDRAEAETQAMADRSAGLIDYRKYLERMREAEVKYHDESSKLYIDNGLAEDEDHKTLLKKKQEADDKYNSKRLALNKDVIERIAAIEERELSAKYDYKLNKSLADELAYSEQLLTIRYNKLMDLQQLYMKGSQEWEKYEREIQDLLYKDQQEKQAAIVKKAAEFRDKFDKMSVAEKYRLELQSLEELYKRRKISEEEYRKWLKALNEQEAKELPGNKPTTTASATAESVKSRDKGKTELDKALAEGRISQDEYEVRMQRINSSFRDNLIEPLKNAKSEWVSMMTVMIDSWMDFSEAINDPDADPLAAFTSGFEATTAVMGAVMSQLTGFIQAELHIQTAAVEKRYDAEIKAAEGNSYRVAKAEKEKEAELAKLKQEANRKMFAMQVIQAVAQTATNALNAYGSAAAIPVVGHILAPIAAGVALAAGMVQVAAIKKQQQASEAQGYSKGGFTRPGAVDEPAGIVHAGEWVASQKLLASPVARPMIEALDYAQRTNTIGSLRSEDVSRSITATQSMARIAEGDPSLAMLMVALSSNSEVIGRLANRLDEPFVTVNTVTGTTGIKKAQDEYSVLMKNKSPKSKRNADIG